MRFIHVILHIYFTNTITTTKVVSGFKKKGINFENIEFNRNPRENFLLLRSLQNMKNHFYVGIHICTHIYSLHM